jgi:hypothetical protein
MIGQELCARVRNGTKMIEPDLWNFSSMRTMLLIITRFGSSDVPGPAWAQTLGLGWALVGLGLPKVKPDPEPRLGPGSGLVGLKPGLDFENWPS